MEMAREPRKARSVVDSEACADNQPAQESPATRSAKQFRIQKNKNGLDLGESCSIGYRHWRVRRARVEMKSDDAPVKPINSGGVVWTGEIGMGQGLGQEECHIVNAQPRQSQWMLVASIHRHFHGTNSTVRVGEDACHMARPTR